MNVDFKSRLVFLINVAYKSKKNQYIRIFIHIFAICVNYKSFFEN